MFFLCFTSINIYVFKIRGGGCDRRSCMCFVERVCVCVDVGVCDGLVAASVPLTRAILSRVTVRPSSVYVGRFSRWLRSCEHLSSVEKKTCIYVY